MFENAHSILLVKLSSIGDVVHALPVAAAARRRYPDAHIAWAVGTAAADLVSGNPHLSETLVVGGKDLDRKGVSAVPPPGAPLALRRALRERRFDLALDLQGLFRSALIAYLSGARDRIGFRNRQEGAFLLNNRAIVPDRRDVHAVEGYLGFAHALRAPAEPLDFTIAVTEADRRAVDELVGEAPSLVALVPGARWPTKRWPAERFAAVAGTLSREAGCTCVVVGGEGDGELARRIQERSGGQALDLTGRTSLKQLAELFRRCRLTIANDTGPMHISAAVGTPTAAIFGPTDPIRLRPYGEGHAVVRAPTPCAPCRRRTCATLRSSEATSLRSTSHPTRCLEAVAPEQVIAAARSIIRPAPSAAGLQASAGDSRSVPTGAPRASQ